MSRPTMVAVVLAALSLPGHGAPDPLAGGLVVTYLSVFVPGDTMDPGQEPLPPARVPAGTDLWYANVEDYTHSITADDLTPDEEPLFDSGPVKFGETAPVTGVASLAPGTYGFYCAYHPFLMRGVLEVA